MSTCIKIPTMQDYIAARQVSPAMDFRDPWFHHRVGSDGNEGIVSATIHAKAFVANTTKAVDDKSPNAPEKLYKLDGRRKILLRVTGRNSTTDLSAAAVGLLVLGWKRAINGAALNALSYENLNMPMKLFDGTVTLGGPVSTNIHPFTQAAVASTTFYTGGTITFTQAVFTNAASVGSAGGGIALIEIDTLGHDAVWVIPNTRTATMTVDVDICGLAA